MQREKFQSGGGRRIECLLVRVVWRHYFGRGVKWGAALAEGGQKGHVEEFKYTFCGAPKVKRSQCWMVEDPQEK